MTLIKDYDILFEVKKKKSVTFSILHFNIEQIDWGTDGSSTPLLVQTTQMIGIQ